METKQKWPVPVYLNGKLVGEMDSRRAVTFMDQSAVETVLKMMESNAVGLSSRIKDGKETGVFNAINIDTLGDDETIKMENHRLNTERKKGRIL